MLGTLPGTGETTSWNRLWDGAAAIIDGSLISSEFDGNITAFPESVVEVKVAYRCRSVAIDSDALDVCRRICRNGLLNWLRVKAVHCHSGADVEVAIMDCVLGSERWENENLRRGRDCEGLLAKSEVHGMRVNFTWIETQKMPREQTGHRRLIIIPGNAVGRLKTWN